MHIGFDKAEPDKVTLLGWLKSNAPWDEFAV
jgi:hypothetical protein